MEIPAHVIRVSYIDDPVISRYTDFKLPDVISLLMSSLKIHMHSTRHQK